MACPIEKWSCIIGTPVKKLPINMHEWGRGSRFESHILTFFRWSHIRGWLRAEDKKLLFTVTFDDLDHDVLKFDLGKMIKHACQEIKDYDMGPDEADLYISCFEGLIKKLKNAKAKQNDAS